MPSYPIQNQTSQLRLKFSGPLVKDWQVALKQDLITLDNNYDYRLVWVDESKSLYYLNQGCDGTDISHWIEYGESARLSVHDENLTYEEGECVYTNNGNLYVATDSVPVNTPISDNNYWLQLSGTSVTMYVPFTDESEVTIQSLVTHPIFQVFIDDKLCDAEILNTSVNNNIWKISFYENSELTPKTGYIVVK